MIPQDQEENNRRIQKLEEKAKSAETSKDEEEKKHAEELASLKTKLQSLQDRYTEQSSRAEIAESRVAELEKTDPEKEAEEKKVVLGVVVRDVCES